jgi:putative RNA 2'-phosphotransferase
MAASRTPKYLAKILATLLARQPEELALVPDAEGFVKIKELLKALHEEEGFGYVNRSHLNEIVLSVPDAPIEIRENRIRAKERSQLPAPAPAADLPAVLFAAVRRRAHAFVLEHGLRAPAETGIVLVPQREAAEKIGRRIDPEPVIVTVQVEACRRRGVEFHRAGEALFLAEAIPPGCFSAAPPPKERPKPERGEAAVEPKPRPSEPAGSFTLDPADIAHAPGAGYIKRTAKGKKIDPKRFKRDSWSRERPPWRR